MIRIRPVERHDVPRLVEIASHTPAAARWNEREYAKLFAPEEARALLALAISKNEEVMGFLVARSVAPDDHEWEIENVAVAGPARRRGFGAQLLEEFLEQARARGASEVFLEVRESNQAACKLYQKWGFREVGRRRNYYRTPDEDALIFRFCFPHSG